MIDSIFVPPSVHMGVGMLVLIVTFLAMLLTGSAAWRGRELSRATHGVLILTQVVLIVQALLGIKLLDQGSGPLQLYIHYVGGLAPLGFFLAMSWWPVRDPRSQSRIAALVAAGSFVFALMTYTIGEAFVRGMT